MSEFPIVIDTETTGVNTNKDGIIQLAAVLTSPKEDGTTKSKTLMSTFCNCGLPIPPDATAIHGFTDETVRWSPPEEWALRQLRMVLDSMAEHGEVYLVGHNSERFDVPLMDTRFKAGIFSDFKQIDTLTAAWRLFPDKAQKLGELFEWYIGKPAVNAHDAAADCYMCAEILAKMMKENELSLSEFSEWTMNPQVWDFMPFGKHKGQEMSTVPKSYLRWCKANFEDPHPDMEATFLHYLD